ncbi:WhiB family transcriptional regulator [Modestobacter lapidis]|nr:WhiB family transcriptional regulator [Modestobacter lapidis]
MAPAESAPAPAFAIPPAALAEWSELARQIADAGTVPCRTADPEAWWPDKRDSVELAVELCRRCPVRAACLDYALAADERYGMWGGLLVAERQEVTDRRRRRW